MLNFRRNTVACVIQFFSFLATRAQNYSVEMACFAYFVAFFTGYPAIYMPAWLLGAKEFVTSLSNAAHHDHLAGRSIDATRTPVICIHRS